MISESFCLATFRWLAVRDEDMTRKGGGLLLVREVCDTTFGFLFVCLCVSLLCFSSCLACLRCDRSRQSLANYGSWGGFLGSGRKKEVRGRSRKWKRRGRGGTDMYILICIVTLHTRYLYTVPTTFFLNGERPSQNQVPSPSWFAFLDHHLTTERASFRLVQIGHG